VENSQVPVNYPKLHIIWNLEKTASTKLILA